MFSSLFLFISSFVLLLLVVTPSNSQTWYQEVKSTANDPASGDYFGYSVSISKDTLVIGAYQKTVNSIYAGAVYIFIRNNTNWVQQAKLIANDTASSDSFGSSVSISEDTVAIGAPNKKVNSFIIAGAVYIFTRNDANWTQQAKLIANDPANYDSFGHSVSIYEDTVAIGAYSKNVNSLTFAGVVYIFTRNDTNWLQQAKLIANDYAQNDHFGNSVSIYGDTLAIGAYQKNVNSIYAGAVYIFTRNDMNWIQQATLIANDYAQNDQFGYSVSISGETVAIGANRKTVNSITVGAVYIFTRNETNWIQQATLIANDPASGDNFGISVSISGDTVAIGAYQKTVNSVIGAGAAYIFTRNGTNWSQQTKLIANDPANYDSFGSSVSIYEDTIAIGAFKKNVNNFTQAGAVYIFTRNESNWMTTDNMETTEWFTSENSISEQMFTTEKIGTTSSENESSNSSAIIGGILGPLLPLLILLFLTI